MIPTFRNGHKDKAVRSNLCAAHGSGPERSGTMVLSSAIFYGILYSMKTTIDVAGRVVVPKKIRDAVQLEAGSELEIRVENGVIQMEPVAAPVQFKKRGGFVVATRPGQAPTLTHEVVEATRERIGGERIQSTTKKLRKR
jgi:AbrB family looped-hinge helix DNA binding protein